MKNIIGVQGEILATEFLKKKKYKIITTNYKNKIGEIDIIAKHKQTLVFVEVKRRSSTQFGLPREAVTAYKQNKIRKVALSYLQETKQTEHLVRFDVIDILNEQITHIENAF